MEKQRRVIMEKHFNLKANSYIEAIYEKKLIILKTITGSGTEIDPRRNILKYYQKANNGEYVLLFEKEVND
jgi:hypothetical protein